MSDVNDDEYDGLRRALRARALSAPTAVDPVAARRAGDARARTRTAVTTSLAFSLVIFAGLGSIYVAAHRSRPSSLGSDTVTATVPPSVSPSPSPALTVGFYTDPETLVAGHSFVLYVTGTIPGALERVDVLWGDGERSAVVADAASAAPPGDQPVAQHLAHTYAEPGPESIKVTVTPSSGQPEVTSFTFSVLPQPAVVQLPPRRPLVTASAGPSASARPSGKPAGTPTPRPIRPTGSPTPTASRPATPTPTASRPATPTPTGSRSATPTATPTPSRSATTTASPSPSATS